MAETQSELRFVRFGAFEVDLRTGELRKDGVKLKFSGHPFQVLVILLERPGDIVTREELQKRLWSDTFVDVERNLNTAVNKIREVLGDSAESPRFIETLSRRGYRFIGKLEAPPHATPVDSNGVVNPGQVGLETAPPLLPQVDPVPRRGTSKDGSRNRFRRRWLLASAAVLVAGLATAIWYLRRPLPQLRVTEYTQITHDGRPKTIAGTDGSRLYFNWNNDPQPTAQVAISGGEIAQMPVALQLPWIEDVSPDGSSLLVSSHEGGKASLWAVQVPAGSLRRLLTDARVHSAAWSPDGKSVVYSMENGDLSVTGSDGTGTRKLAAVGLTGPLSWSPDGSKIRFSWDNRLWEVSSDGSGLHPLLPGWRPSSSQCCGHWTPDGKFFVFLSRGAHFYYNDHLAASQLWVLDERRGLFRRTPTEPVQLTSGPIRWNSPIPSKDGTKIFAHGVILRGELVRYDAQSSRLQPYLGGISAEFVTFSPDGQFVAYVTFPEGILWRANRDGSHPVQLTDAPWYPLNPRWSPDGSQILFFQYDWAGHSRSYILPSQGGTPRSLLPEDNEGQSDPNWSPDGHKIVFSTLETLGQTLGVFNLRVLDLASHQITTLPGSEGVWSPRWSPNGRFIAGLYAGPTGRVKIFDFETQRWSVVQGTGGKGVVGQRGRRIANSSISCACGRWILVCFESAYRVAMRSALSI